MNEYKIMWIYVYFDLPTTTKKERRAYTQFRKALIQDGFKMEQYSIYVRHCPSLDHTKTHIRRVKRAMPSKGLVSFLKVTDKQFSMVENYHGKKKQAKKQRNVEQLLLFA